MILRPTRVDYGAPLDGRNRDGSAREGKVGVPAPRLGPLRLRLESSSGDTLPPTRLDWTRNFPVARGQQLDAHLRRARRPADPSSAAGVSSRYQRWSRCPAGRSSRGSALPAALHQGRSAEDVEVMRQGRSWHLHASWNLPAGPPLGAHQKKNTWRRVRWAQGLKGPGRAARSLEMARGALFSVPLFENIKI